ncbi:haloacid dehalogenase, type II [Kwoniella newhampshirensis]|uniref:Haloacid dehalogenase, type II n=1 Tax=Kwoniella newhampshirensis TaxID=1651941 RepID=A0AAW0Z0M3_9TREE
MSIPPALQPVRSLTFDLMGTCADYTTSLLVLLTSPGSSLPSSVDPRELIKAWRSGFFDTIFELHARGEEKSVDEVHRIVLDRILAQRGVEEDVVGRAEREKLVMGWHDQTAWPDAVQGIQRLRTKYDCVVVANGTTRLQLDIVSSSRLPFHALFSSQLIGHTKPDPKMYCRSMELLRREPAQVAMVAAHAYDLRAAKAVGMRTIYIQRDTEDPDEDMALIQSEVDLFVDGRTSAGIKGGLSQLASILGV